MAIRKRCLLWDYTNTRDNPDSLNQLKFDGPFCCVSNWNAWTPPELSGRLPFRPMARTPAQLQGDEWSWIVASGAETVHFLNEPERQGVAPEAAAALWREKMVKELREGKGMKLAGPSCASDEAGRTWLRSFMALIDDCQPDFLGAHYYGTVAAEAETYLSSLHDEFGLPVIVSEIASISRDAPAVEAFTRDVANWMDEADWVVEYGFFGCMKNVADDFVSPAAQLMNQDGTFTPLMNKLMTEQPIS